MDRLQQLSKDIVEAFAAILYIAGSVLCRTCDLVFSAECLTRRYHWGLSTTWPTPFTIYLGQLAKENVPRQLSEATIVSFYEANNYSALISLVRALMTYKSISKRRKAILVEIPTIVQAARDFRFNAAGWLLPRLFIELEGILRDYARIDLHEKSHSSPIVPKSIGSLKPTAAEFETSALSIITEHFFRNTRKRPARKRSISRNIHLHGLLPTPPTLANVIQLLLLIEVVASLIDRRRDEAGELNRRKAAAAELLTMAIQKGRAIQNSPALLYCKTPP